MTSAHVPAKALHMILEAETAADIMSSNPVSLFKTTMSVKDAVDLFIDRNFDAVPVVDKKGRPVGVVTVTDILVHHRQLAQSPENDSPLKSALVCVDAIMTPTIFAVESTTPAPIAVRKLLDLGVHHLFVLNEDGVLIGVISTCDILRRLELQR